MRSLLFVVFALISLTAFSQQTSKKVKWTTSVSKKEVKVGEEVELIFKGKIDDNWYMYSSDFDPDLGPLVATFNLAENDTYEKVGDVVAVGSKSKFDDMWGGKYTYFTGTAEFRQKVRILKENPVINVKLNGQVCSEETQACIPVFESFKFDQIKAIPVEKTTGSVTPGPKPKTVSARPSTATPEPVTKPCLDGDLKCLQDQRQKTYGKNGNDEARDQLKEFVRKYGN